MLNRLSRVAAPRLSKKAGYSSSRLAGARILASDSIEPVCAETFKKRGHELVEKFGIKKDELVKIIHEYDGLVVRSGTKVTKDIINAGVNLKIIGRAGTGVDNIDVPAATSKGVLVVNTTGGNTISTGELALTHILALARNIPQATASLKAGRWDRSKYTGTELQGKTLGIFGVGRIGREVAKWCRGFGMTTIGYDPVLSEQSARANAIEPVSLEELFSKSDFITIHSPLTKETQYVFDAKNLAKCKKGVRIINCARGGIIDEAALLEALNSGHVGGASLDTLEVEPPVAASLELRKHPHVVVSPHLGASTFDAQERVAKAIAENMSDILDGGKFVGVVNAPDLGAANAHPHILPYVLLAERMGSLQAQLLKNNKISAITVTLRGKDVSDNKLTDVIRSAVLKGVLGELSSQPVTFVNAISMSEELGLKVMVNMSERTDTTSGYMNSLTVDMEVEGMLNYTRSVEGTVFGRDELRITRVDNFQVDLPPGEHLLMFNNYDAPGVLRKLSEKLAGAGVNIAHFSLGRAGKGKQAMGALVLDQELPAELLSSIGKYAGVTNVVQLHLKQSVDPNLRIRSSDSQGVVYGSNKPTMRPRNPEFSSGPCKKRPGYSLAALRTDVLGRSHRSKLGKSRIKKAIDDTRRILGVPDDYLIGIVPASDTGAYEMAIWSMLGERPVDACYWEAFGKGWNEDTIKHLGLKETTREFKGDYGKLPELAKTNPDHDILFTFNGTTSGVRVPDLDWISDQRTGLTFNDATSAAFAMDIDWSKVDVTTYSWQKVLGGEGAHGVLILSPRAVKRLETFVPKNRPLPKIFRLTKKDKEGKLGVDKAIFQGDTINTPSMLCVEDYLDALAWADSIGGLQGLIKRSQANLEVIEKFAAQHDWLQFLAQDKASRSSTSVCLVLPKLTKDQVKTFVSLLEKEGVAYDIGAYRDAPDGLRIWCGATVEKSDLEALMPWLKWAHETVLSTPAPKAK
jgi:phosphoserine aminotransferase